MPTRDAELIEELLHVTAGMNGEDVAAAIGVSGATISKWRNGKPIKYLHAPIRESIRAFLANPGRKFLKPTPPSAAEGRAAAEQAQYAAGVLWSVAQDAEHLARKARDAHARITGRQSEADRAAEILDQAEESVARGRRPDAPAKRAGPQRKRRRA